MFDLKKVKKARKRLHFITSFLFKLFQLNLRYKEKRKDYGIEIFEYFYLPWRSDEKFKNHYELIKEHTLNPKSRLFTIYDMSKRYLIHETTFVEVGCWKGGVSGLVALENKNKDIDYFICDTFEGVVNVTKDDTFFKGQEYNSANIDDVNEVAKISNRKFNIIQGVFPNSMKKQALKRPISFAHIDVDTYISAKESFDFIFSNSINGALIILDDYGGWFTDGVTKFGNELKNNNHCIAIPNHLGQLLIYKI